MKVGKSDPELETLLTRIEHGEIDLQPDFQRGEVWDLRRQQRLVDTILREWYIPAVHFVVDPEGNESVLDGQQRLVTVRDFMAGKFPVDGTIDPQNPNLLQLNGLYYSELPAATQKAIRRFVIPVITLTDFLPQEPNELFFRLNQSYNLTPPEKRNALHGQARNQVKELVNSLAEIGLLQREVIGFGNGRLAHDDVIARTCVAIEIGTLRRHINNAVVEQFYRESLFSTRTIREVDRAGHQLLKLVEATDNRRVRFNKGTLQTWITYCYWAPKLTGPLPRPLLFEFERDRSLVKLGESESAEFATPGLFEVVSLYDDRASYRVTDVMSVTIRDLALHLYSEARFQTKSRRRSEALLSTLRRHSKAPAQPQILSFIESSNWGDPILDRRTTS